MISVAPSLPAASFAELAALANALAGIAQELQIDIVDGDFVPAVSWPFTEHDPAAEWGRIKQLTEHYQIEMDCMVMEPMQYFEQFATAGVTRVIVHIGSTERFAETVSAARGHGFAVGVAFTNDISLVDVETTLEVVDFAQIMGIQHVGTQGQPFDERTLTTAKMLRASHPALDIAVDGHVNKTTIPLLREAGVNRFAPGSAIAKADDPAAAYRELLALAQA